MSRHGPTFPAPPTGTKPRLRYPTWTPKPTISAAMTGSGKTTTFSLEWIGSREPASRATRATSSTATSTTWAKLTVATRRASATPWTIPTTASTTDRLRQIDKVNGVAIQLAIDSAQKEQAAGTVAVERDQVGAERQSVPSFCMLDIRKGRL